MPSNVEKRNYIGVSRGVFRPWHRFVGLAGAAGASKFQAGVPSASGQERRTRECGVEAHGLLWRGLRRRYSSRLEGCGTSP